MKSKQNNALPQGDQEVLPRTLGRLTLLKQVARGGMGEVYLAATGGIEGAERPCVVKIIRREHADDRSFLARFLDEARIQAQLHHPGVAQILDAASDEQEKPYVVVEYVEGRNLSDVRHRTQQLGVRVAWPDAIALGITLGEALAHVHERADAAGKPLEIVHRDLSPQNVMVGYGGDVKLIDFGTARGENRRCHTVAGIVFAKPGYVAPEVANNNPGGVPADIYAFGIMLWELIAGRRFLAGDASEHLAAVAAGTRSPSPLAQLVDSPRDLDVVIGRMTATRIEDRYASAHEAVQDLVRLLKVAPSLANGERSVRARVANLMQRLYPAEPARSRAEFVRLVASARRSPSARPAPLLPSPSPAPAEEGDPSLLAGTRYRLMREIGRGAMGVVHEAFHVDLGRTVALKVLPAEHSGAAYQERLCAEARALARLRHDNLVTLHDFGIATDGRPYYAMELLEGETLESTLDREHALGWREAARLGIQACHALEAAHDAGVVHRDIKPANLFLTRDGVLKLLDFGVARSVTEGTDAEQPAGAISLTGTPEYVAPEQIDGGEADARSDVYGLGVVLFELVTGLLPYDAPNTVALLDMKRRKDPDSPRRLAPKRGISRMLDEAIQRALERDPADRFQSAAELRALLEAALREPEERRQRRRQAGFAALVAFATVLAVAAIIGQARPEVRARAMHMLQPVVARIASLRGAAPPPAAAAVAAARPRIVAPAPRLQPVAVAPAAAPVEAVAVPGVVAPDDPADPGDAVATEAVGRSGAEPSADEAPAPVAVAAASGAEAVQVADAVKAAEALMQSGHKLKGFDQLRRLGKAHKHNAEALAAWSRAAADMKAWGEALRAARQWATIDKSPAAQLYFADMLRLAGRRDAAIQALVALAKAHPDCDVARARLHDLGGDARLARN